MLTEAQAKDLLQRRKAIRTLGTPQALETMSKIDREISTAVRAGRWPNFTRADSQKPANGDHSTRPISRPPKSKWEGL